MSLFRGEIVLPLAFAVIISLMQLTPTLVPYFIEPNDIYLGFEFPADYYVYASFVEDAKHGNIFLENKQTSEPQLRRYFLPQFSIMGEVANCCLSISNVLLLNRFLQSIFFLLVLWYFLGLLFSNFKERLFAYVFIPIAGGLGWLVMLLGEFVPLIARIRSSDLTYWLGYSLVGNMYFPHRFWALGLVLLAFILILNYIKTKNVKYLIASGFLGMLITFIHPVTAIFFFITVGVMQLLMVIEEKFISKNNVFIILTTGLFSLPFIIYSVWAFQDPIINSHQKIYFFISKIEPLGFYLIGFGLVAILALIGLKKLPKNLPLKSLLLAWLVTAFLLTRVGFGVEYLVLLYVILAILASKGLFLLKDRLPKYAIILMVLLAIGSAPLVLNERIQDTINNPLSFITQEEQNGIDFLASQPKGIVLSRKKIGTILSWKSHHKPMIGQSYLTTNRERKQKDVEQFFEGNIDILYKYAPDYVWVPEKYFETLNQTSALELIFENSTVRIYKHNKTETNFT